MGRPVILGAFLLVYPCYAPPTARPVLLFQVMAATEAQGLGVDQREDAAGVHGGIGCTDHEGECAVSRVQVICLHFSRALVHLTPLSDLKSGPISSETTLVPGGEPRAGPKGDGVWRPAVARLRLSWVGGESEKTCPPDRGERSFCCLPEFHVWVWVRSGSHVCD